MFSRVKILIEINKINVFYGDLQVLWDISLQVKKGECVAILGSNGAGKTTLLCTILGLRPPTPKSGFIKFFDKQIDKLPPWEVIRLGVSLVPEGRRVFRNMTVMENLLMGAHVQKTREKKKEMLEKIFQLFPKLKERKSQLAGTLSGGERQMLVIGRALMATPQLLMLDEPSLGLAPKLVLSIFKSIKDIHEEGITVIIADQHVHNVLEIAERGYVLESGRIVLMGSSKELLENKEVKRKYLGL